MPIYSVTLTPVEKFFFGEKNTFGENNQNYFVRSARFPQQTALLGLLRYQLLRLAGDDVFKNNKIQDKQKAEELIGARSFSPADPSNCNWGIIEGLSPLFIKDLKSDEWFLPAGIRCSEKKDRELLRTTDAQQTDRLPADIRCSEKKALSLQLKAGEPPLVDKYDPKSALNAAWISISNKGTVMDESDFFSEDMRVGIRKNKEKEEDDENGFFQQTYYRFDNQKGQHNYCFAFRFQASESVKFADSPEVVYLGGERQPFIMSVQQEKDKAGLLPIFEEWRFGLNQMNLYTVLLLSDADIPEEAVEKAAFAVTHIREFSCLLTNVRTTKRYYNRSDKRACSHDDKRTDIYLSHEQELYRSGSLFYFTDEAAATAFQQKIAAVAHFRAIGYNYTILIHPTSNNQ